jgi:hypothetical protein
MNKRCFVVMGFGEKTDLATGRLLDLDKTYRIIIKKAVEEAGFECVRADDTIHSGIIDLPMYEHLLQADLVVADLSTSNPNAIYELGIRHALRPHTTIVIAEKEFKFPFDLGHLVIRKYEHLGKGIDSEEGERCREELTSAIKHLFDGEPKVDSPLFTYLNALKPAYYPVAAKEGAMTPDVADAGKQTGPLPSELLTIFREARKRGEWLKAAKYLQFLRELRPDDAYLIQQQALATYKSKDPDESTALHNAKNILRQLQPSSTTDPETLGLWGAIHKRIWDLTKDRDALDTATWAYEKGFYLKNDHYNGINLAFLLNCRARVSTGREAIADRVLAERIRRRVILVCEDLICKPIAGEDGKADPEEEFWIQASLVEAYFGASLPEKAEALRAKIESVAPEPWMAESMNHQLGKLKELLLESPS